MIDLLRTARGMARGVARGDLFPAGGRVRPKPAPGGTTAEPREGFELLRHRVPIAGLSRPLTLLQISDAHVRHPTRGFEKLANELVGLAADVVVLTGDIVAREWQMTAVHHFLSHVPHGRLGTFAVMGNWEHWSGWDPERWRKALEPHKIRLLRDEHVEVGPIALVGTEDATAAEPDLDRALAPVGKGLPTVVLSHSPGVFPKIARPGVDLVLSGHSHGGQVRVPGLGAVWVPRGTGPYVAGWYEENGSHLYVSRGLGWSMVPLRARCPAEVALIELVPGESGEGAVRRPPSADAAVRRPPSAVRSEAEASTKTSATATSATKARTTGEDVRDGRGAGHDHDHDHGHSHSHSHSHDHDEEGEDDLEVDEDRLRTWLGEGVVLVDIREPGELRHGGWAEGALKIPMNSVPDRLDEIPKDRKVVVYCAAGARSYAVTAWLRENGVPAAWSLAGGFPALRAAGAKIERS